MKSMLDYNLEYWRNQPTDQPGNLNSFAGTFQISDHSLIPDSFNDFLLERFHGAERIRRIPLEDINSALNEAWEGPGSMVKIVQLTHELRNARRAGISTERLTLDEVRTIDDYDSEDFEFKYDDSKDKDQQ